MKKILLFNILSFCIFASLNAQNFALYNAATKGSPFNGSPFTFNDNGTFAVDTAAASPYTITAAGSAGSNCGSGTDGCYYISGFGNGSYTAGGDPQAIGYTATNFATDKFFMNVFTNAHNMKVKVQFSTFTAGVQDTDLYGYEFDLSTTNAATAFTDVSVDMSSFSKIVSNNPDGTTFLTDVIAQKIGKVEFVLVVTSNGGAGPGEVQFGNMTIGTSNVLLGINKKSPVTNLHLAPNPASDLTVVNYSSPSNTFVTVADLKGNVVKTVNGSTTDAVINTSDLTSGIYMVTVVVEGVPSAFQKLVVK